MAFSDTNLQFAISKQKQNDYITPVAAAPAAYIEQIITDKSFIKKSVPTTTNKGQTTGQRFATESRIEGVHNTELSMPFEVSFQNIGRYFNAAMGVCVSAPQATLFKHTFDLLDTKISQQLPAYTIIQQAAPSQNGLDIKAPSMVAKSLSLSGDGAAICKATVEWMGSGEYVQGSGVTWVTHVDSTQGAENYVYSTTSKLTRANPGGGSSNDFSLCENLGWEISINNSFAEDDYGCMRLFDSADISKGCLRSHLLLADTEISAKFKFKLPASSDEMLKLQNQAPLELTLLLLSTATQLATTKSIKFTMPLNKYKVVEHSSEDGFIYLNIEPEVLYSVAAGKALEVEVVNNITSY